jgi:chemotaxis protein CheY-P-specific phosphatase CheC
MSEYCDALSRVSLKVLEDWAMMLVDPVQEGSTEELFGDNSLMESSVTFHGAHNGKVLIVAPKTFLAQLSDNLLGEEDRESLGCSAEEDGFKEMANVLAGNLLTEAFGDKVVFDLMSPEVSPIEKDTFSELMKSNETVFFVADDLPISVTFVISNT